MNSQNFIINEIDQLVARFPAIQVRYQFDGDHIIEVLPSNVMKSNDSFQDAIDDLFIEFDEKYTEDLMFVTEGDYIRIKNVTHQKKGSQFQNNAIFLLLEKENLKVKVGVYKSYKLDKLYENGYSKVESKHTEEVTATVAGESNYAMAA